MTEFVANVLEVMAPWASVSARRMFGGYGLYREAQMFAIVIEDTLYLKTDTPAAIDSSPRAARRSSTRAEAGASTRATGALRPHASMIQPR